jgi:hypothetical protein
VLSLCDKALEAKNREIELSDLAIKQLTERTQYLDKRVLDLETDSQHFWRNPFIMGALGLVVGGAIVVGLSR